MLAVLLGVAAILAAALGALGLVHGPVLEAAVVFLGVAVILLASGRQGPVA